MTEPFERDTDDLYERPRADELVEAVIEFLEKDLLANADGELRHRLRVTRNVLAIVQRELRESSDFAPRHAENLARLGVASDRELAEAIRRGDLDGSPIIREVLMDETIQRLAVSNPRWLQDN